MFLRLSQGRADSFVPLVEHTCVLYELILIKLQITKKKDKNAQPRQWGFTIFIIMSSQVPF